MTFEQELAILIKDQTRLLVGKLEYTTVSNRESVIEYSLYEFITKLEKLRASFKPSRGNG